MRKVQRLVALLVCQAMLFAGCMTDIPKESFQEDPHVVVDMTRPAADNKKAYAAYKTLISLNRSDIATGINYAIYDFNGDGTDEMLEIQSGSFAFGTNAYYSLHTYDEENNSDELIVTQVADSESPDTVNYFSAFVLNDDRLVIHLSDQNNSYEIYDVITFNEGAVDNSYRYICFNAGDSDYEMTFRIDTEINSNHQIQDKGNDSDKITYDDLRNDILDNISIQFAPPHAFAHASNQPNLIMTYDEVMNRLGRPDQ